MEKFIKIIKKTLYILAWTMAVVLISFIFLQIYIVDSTKKYIYSDPEYLPEFKTALVLGASVKGSVMSDILADRAESALELYRKGKVDQILVSGDANGKYYDEVTAVRKFLNEKGVSDKDILIDGAGLDTYDSLYRARDVFGVNTVIVVTQNYHLSRAIFLARNMGIEAYGLLADKHRYQDINYFQMREWLARAKAVYDLIFHSVPAYLKTK